MVIRHRKAPASRTPSKRKPTRQRPTRGHPSRRGHGKSRSTTPKGRRSPKRPANSRTPRNRKQTRGRGHGHARGHSRGRGRGRGRGRSRSKTPEGRSPKHRANSKSSRNRSRTRGRGQSRGRGRGRGHARGSRHKSPKAKHKNLFSSSSFKKSPTNNGTGKSLFSSGGPATKKPLFHSETRKKMPLFHGGTKKKQLFQSKQASTSSSSVPPPPPKKHEHFGADIDAFPNVSSSPSSAKVNYPNSAAIMLKALRVQKDEIETKYEEVNDQLHDLMAGKEELMKENDDLRHECAELRDESIKMLKIKVHDDELLKRQEEMTIKYNLLIDSKEELLKKNEELKEQCDKLKGQRGQKSVKRWYQNVNEIPIIYRDDQFGYNRLKMENEYLKNRMFEQSMPFNGKGLDGMKNDKHLQQVLRDNKDIRQIYENVTWRLTKANEKYHKLKKSRPESAPYIEQLNELQKQYDDLLKSNHELIEKYQDLEHRYEEKTKETNKYRQNMDEILQKYDHLKRKQAHKRVRIQTTNSRLIARSDTQSYQSSNSTFEHLSIDDAKNQNEYMKKLRRNHQKYKLEKQRQIDIIRRKLAMERQKNKKLRHVQTHSVHTNTYESKESESMDAQSDKLMHQILNLKERIEEYVDTKGEVIDTVTIVGKKDKFKNVHIIANERGVQIGADTFEYGDIISLFRSKDSETEWIMTTNTFMVQILASSAKMRDRFVSFIQSQHLQFL